MIVCHPDQREPLIEDRGNASRGEYMRGVHKCDEWALAAQPPFFLRKQVIGGDLNSIRKGQVLLAPNYKDSRLRLLGVFVLRSNGILLI